MGGVLGDRVKKVKYKLVVTHSHGHVKHREYSHNMVITMYSAR